MIVGHFLNTKKLKGFLLWGGNASTLSESVPITKIKLVMIRLDVSSDLQRLKHGLK